MLRDAAIEAGVKQFVLVHRCDLRHCRDQPDA